jgi:hypothetical protein
MRILACKSEVNADWCQYFQLRTRIIEEIDFKDPLKHHTEQDIRKADNWAADISSSAGESGI